MNKVNKFVLENILSRTIGPAIPPYWLKGKSFVQDVNGEYESDAEDSVTVADDYEQPSEQEDIQMRTLARNSALGYPMCMPLEIELPQKKKSPGAPEASAGAGGKKWWTLPWEPLITVKGKNVIVRRRAAKSEKRGTIKEHWTQDDYEISIQGILMDCFNEGRYPREDVERLRSICESKKELEVHCPLLELFGVSRIVIEDYDIPFTKGENIQGYVIKAYSDDLFDLLIDETTLKQP